MRWAILILLVLAFACSKAPEEQPLPAPTAPPVTATCNDGIRNQGEEGIDCGGPCPPCLPQEYVLTASHEDALKQKLKLSTKAEFLVSSYPQGLSVGESHVFALGITNVMQEERKFMLELVFTNARDTNNNPITVDKQTILRWLDRNEFEDYTLEKYQQVFLPIGVTVGPEIAPGVSTVPGNYYFDVVLKYQRTQYTVDSYITLPFSFRVV